MARLGGTNARDVRMLLDGKADPNLVKILADLAERQDHLFHLLEQLAHAMDTLAESVLVHTKSLSVLKDAHEKAKEAKALGVKVGSEAADDTP